MLSSLPMSRESTKYTIKKSVTKFLLTPSALMLPIGGSPPSSVAMFGLFWIKSPITTIKNKKFSNLIPLIYKSLNFIIKYLLHRQILSKLPSDIASWASLIPRNFPPSFWLCLWDPQFLCPWKHKKNFSFSALWWHFPFLRSAAEPDPTPISNDQSVKQEKIVFILLRIQLFESNKLMRGKNL